MTNATHVFTHGYFGTITPEDPTTAIYTHGWFENPTFPDTLPATFTVRRAYEGPQIIIEWIAPLETAGVTELRLLRRRYGFPQDENDGDVIFSGASAATIISDVAVEPCLCYYYKLFAIMTSGLVIKSAAVQGSVIALETGYYGPKMWDLMPAEYQLSDKGLDEGVSVKRSLTEGAAAGGTEVYNLTEDGSVLYGPLRRFLRVLGPLLDEGKGLIDCFPTQLDVDDACTPELEGLAALLGLKLNEDLAPESQRNEVRVWVEQLKVKGTIPGLISRILAVSGLTAVVYEQHNNVLYANDANRTSLGFTPEELANINSEFDTIYRSVGWADGIPPFWLWFSVFLTIDPATFELTLPIARKICIGVRESSPTCHTGFVFVRTSDSDALPFTFGEVISDYNETSDDDAMPVSFAEVATDEQTANAAKWLIMSDPTKTFNTADYTAVFADATLP